MATNPASAETPRALMVRLISPREQLRTFSLTII